MPPYLPKSWNRFFVWLNGFATVISLLLFIWGGHEVRPGILSSACMSGGVAIWMAKLGRHRKDMMLIWISVPFVVIMFMAVFDVTSYLLSAATSAALMYLFAADLHAQS